MEQLSFAITIPEKILHCKTISLPSSIFIWIGEDDSRFDNLDIASTTRFSTLPCSVHVFGEGTGSLAHKLTKRLGKQVLLSYNVEMDPLNQGMNEDFVLKEVITQLTKKDVSPGS